MNFFECFYHDFPVFVGMCVRIGRVGVLMTNKVNRKIQSGGGGDNCQNKYRKGCSARLCYALPDCICFSGKNTLYGIDNTEISETVLKYQISDFP